MAHDPRRTIGTEGSDIDHVVVGPAGVFTLNTKCHPDGQVTVYEYSIWVNGFKQTYLRNSKFEAERSAKLLSADADSTCRCKPSSCSST